MSKYTETRIMSSEDLRLLCIKKNWYTCGDCEDYDKLLKMPDGKNITTNIIIKIATDIYEHSDNANFDDICNSLLRICVSYILTK